MAERDEKGRFKPKEITVSPPPRYVPRMGVTKENVTVRRMMIAFGLIACLVSGIVFGLMITQAFGKEMTNPSNTTPQQEQQAQLLNTEKELVSKIIDYEIKYGTGSVSWGVNVQFQE